MEEKERQVFHQAIDRGFNKKDIQRIGKKLRDASKDYFSKGSIVIPDIETLSMMIDEPITYRFEWAMIRLCRDGKLSICKKENEYIIDIIKF